MSQSPNQPDPSPLAVTPQTIRMLQIAVAAVGAAVLALSVFFNLYLYKQNNLLIAEMDGRTRLLALQEPIFETNSRQMEALVRDLAGFAQQHHDLMPILVKYRFIRVHTASLFDSSTVLPSTP